MSYQAFNVGSALARLRAHTHAEAAEPAEVYGLAEDSPDPPNAKVAEVYVGLGFIRPPRFPFTIPAMGPVSFDGIFVDLDRVAAALLKKESPEEKAHNDRLAKADGWCSPMVPVPFFPYPPIAPPTASTAGKVLPLVTKPVVAKLVTDPDLDFVRSALTANIFAASRARGLTFRLDADGDLIIQGKGLTERDRLQFEPHETVIVEALNP